MVQFRNGVLPRNENTCLWDCKVSVVCLFSRTVLLYFRLINFWFLIESSCLLMPLNYLRRKGRPNVAVLRRIDFIASRSVFWLGGSTWGFGPGKSVPLGCIFFLYVHSCLKHLRILEANINHCNCGKFH
jgi:hypothetical protein